MSDLYLPGAIRLFTFTRQSLVQYYCTGDRDRLVDGKTYIAGQIDRSDVRETVERAKDKITITLAYLRDPSAPVGDRPTTQPLGDWWFPQVPSSTVLVRCATWDGTNPQTIDWIGQVTQPKFGDAQLELTCEPVSGSMRNRNQGAKWQRGCWKTVYSTGIRGCNLDPASTQCAATLASVSGVTITAPEFASSAYSLAGGALLWTTLDGVTERRAIMSHSGTTLTLLAPHSDLAPGRAVIALPGCERTWAACDARGNTINYGGSVYKPVKNPKEDSMSWG